ncbi:hypothetical protein THTE_3415 [Thermogutta terrifontis]|uniref:Uncharacterized protein n=1 Tax=Thermogutta terrifontis TaxID=1331910 RepID=A0A286RJ78_9BACT|nr:hypothetical protein THTE_3415 [Thermogutta terrifontis]
MTRFRRANAFRKDRLVCGVTPDKGPIKEQRIFAVGVAALSRDSSTYRATSRTTVERHTLDSKRMLE